MSIIDFLNNNTGAVTALATIITALATVALAFLTARYVKLTSKLNKIHRPYIVYIIGLRSKCFPRHTLIKSKDKKYWGHCST